MDLRDRQAGGKKEFFWFKAKRELIGILLGKLNAGRRLRILNVGAGTGEDLPTIIRYGEIYAIDVDPRALESVPKELVSEKRACDACRMPYPDGFFDLAVGFDVLEHIQDDISALSEIHRVLKPDGFFVFTVPAFDFLYSSRDRALGHFRRYDKKSLKNRLAGFSCVESGYWVFSLFLPVAVTRLLRRKQADPGIDISLPKPIDSILYFLLKAENWLIQHGISLPMGITLYGIYRKRRQVSAR